MIWTPKAVPNGSTADVVIPTITMTSTGQIVSSSIDIAQGQNYTVRSMSISNNSVSIEGSLAVQGLLTLTTGGLVNLQGSLAIGSLSNDGTLNGQGSLTSANAITNQGMIYGLTIDAAGFTNTGSLSGVTLDLPTGHFTNLSGGTLTGGSYDNVTLNVGGLVTTDAADITSELKALDPTTGAYVELGDMLRTIAPAGTLTIDPYFSDTYTTTSLTVQGKLVLPYGRSPATFTAQTLDVAAGGSVIADGTITAAVTGNGLIQVAPIVVPATSFTFEPASSLLINGAVSGSGTLEITQGKFIQVQDSHFGGTFLENATLELNGAASAKVVFDDQYGALVLDQPGAFTGSIQTSGSGDTLTLVGIALGSITGSSYQATAGGGTLTLDRGASSISLHLIGSFDASSFALQAGAQPLSSTPPSLIVRVLSPQQTGNAFVIDGSHGVQNLHGSTTPSFINTSNAATAGTASQLKITVDLAQGFVTGTDLYDAHITNIQGVQLGAQTSDVIGLTSGTDYVYDGSGFDRFYGSGATDIVQGGSGVSQVFGSTGNEIFYGNGGTDVMWGGSAANFMSGGSTAASTDLFYATTGNDYLYGHGGAIRLVGGTGNELLTAGSGFNELDGAHQPDSQVHIGLSEFIGSSGTDLFYGSVGTNLMNQGSGTDTFVGSTGTDYIYGGAGRSFTYAGGGTDVVTTGAGNDYVKSGTGRLYFNDTAANLHAGRFDYIDNFSGAGSTDLYLPTAVQSATSFVSQNGGTAVLTAVSGGTAEVFAAGADVAAVQAHTHFTL